MLSEDRSRQHELSRRRRENMTMMSAPDEVGAVEEGRAHRNHREHGERKTRAPSVRRVYSTGGRPTRNIFGKDEDVEYSRGVGFRDLLSGQGPGGTRRPGCPRTGRVVVDYEESVRANVRKGGRPWPIHGLLRIPFPVAVVTADGVSSRYAPLYHDRVSCPCT